MISPVTAMTAFLPIEDRHSVLALLTSGGRTRMSMTTTAPVGAELPEVKEMDSLVSIAIRYDWSMQLSQLAYFVAVAEEGSFTRAAERVGVAQPSLSQQVKALETDLGALLLHRARGKVGLTASGETLLPVARRMLADAETARREIRELAALGRGRVRLGATPSL